MRPPANDGGGRKLRWSRAQADARKNIQSSSSLRAVSAQPRMRSAVQEIKASIAREALLQMVSA
jgi:hypothetical protein